MPAKSLIDPNNRLLGWATNDFSNYGGQPSVTIAYPGRDIRGDTLTVANPHQSGGSQTVEDRGDHAGQPIDQLFATNDAVEHSAPASGIAQPSYTTSPAFDQTSGFVPADGGASGITPLPLSFAVGSAAPGGNSVGDAASLAGAQGLSLSPAIVDGGLPTVSAPSLLPVDFAAALVSPQLHLADAVAHGLSATTDHLADLSEASGLVSAPVAAVGLNDIALDTVHLAALDGPTLSDLGGTDPGAGLTTLLSIVDSTDAFSIVPDGTDASIFNSSGTMLDALAADAPDTLLGDAATHATDGVLPDHHEDGALGIL